MNVMKNGMIMFAEDEKSLKSAIKQIRRKTIVRREELLEGEIKSKYHVDKKVIHIFNILDD